MATTAKGYPYPVGTDRVMDGDDAIGALANAVDTKLGVAAAGTVTSGTPSAINTAVGVAVTFPAGRFTVAPVVFATPAISPVNVVAPIGVTAMATTGCTLWFSRSSGLTPIPITYLAIQNP